MLITRGLPAAPTSQPPPHPRHLPVFSQFCKFAISRIITEPHSMGPLRIGVETRLFRPSFIILDLRKLGARSHTHLRRGWGTILRLPTPTLSQPHATPSSCVAGLAPASWMWVAFVGVRLSQLLLYLLRNGSALRVVLMLVFCSAMNMAGSPAMAADTGLPVRLPPCCRHRL